MLHACFAYPGSVIARSISQRAGTDTTCQLLIGSHPRRGSVHHALAY